MKRMLRYLAAAVVAIVCVHGLVFAYLICEVSWQLQHQVSR
jgi:hypothetical protein